jgi:hypothetical protein
MSNDLTSSVVRILNLSNIIVGTGFIVNARGLIATCAHVVNEAGSAPGKNIKIQFEAGGEAREARVTEEWWRNPENEDIAILQVIDGLPAGIYPVSLGASNGIRNGRALGFASPGKTWSNVEILGESTIFETQRRLQLRSIEITNGFSGAPLWDEVSCTVIGMVSEILKPDRYGRLGETAYAITSELLQEACPALKPEPFCPSKSFENNKEKLIKSIEQQIEYIRRGIDDDRRAHKQYETQSRATQDLLIRSEIDRHAEELEEKIETKLEKMEKLLIGLGRIQGFTTPYLKDEKRDQ